MTIIDHHGVADGYEAYYGLVESPFSLNADPRFLFDSRSHAAALELVMQAFRRRETLVVLTAGVGVGKTMLCRTVLQRLPRRTFLSVIANPLLSSTDLLKQVLEDFGIVSKDQEALSRATHHDLIRTLEQFLRTLTQLQAHAVIMVDEAQHLRPDVLEEIRLLSNLGSEGGQLLQIVLVGQPELSDVLAQPEMRQLEQRISHRIELRPLEPSEIEHYIERRMWVAYGSPEDTTYDESRVRFTPAALASIADCSGGLPRVVNLLCDRALENAYTRTKPTVDASAVLNAARQLKITIPLGTRVRPYRYPAAAAVLLVLAAGAWTVWRVQGSWSVWPTGTSGTTAPIAGASGQPAAPAVSAPAIRAATLHEGESFNLLVASFRTPAMARAIAEQTIALGLPGFVRLLADGWQQVLVGPYASREEALEAQQRLDEGHIAGSRVVSTPTSDVVAAATATGSSAVARTFLLPAADRASLVIELADDAARAIALTTPDDRSFGVEIGPFHRTVAAQDFQPGPGSTVVDTVAVRSVSQPNDTLARVTVQTQMPVTGTVRLTKRRVYVDLAPRAALEATSPVAPSQVPAAAKSPDAAAPAPAPPPPPATLSNDEWDAAMLAQARELSKIPDVRAVQRLRTQLLQRRGRPIDEPPIASSGDRVMSELIGYLEVAQKLQLAMDARLLREAQEKEPP